MTAFTLVSGALPERERNARIFDGEILVFRQVAPVRELVDVLAAHVVARVGDTPPRIHESWSPDAVHTTADATRKAVLKDERVTAHLNAAFEAVGVDLDDTYGDGVKLRVQPPRREASGNLTSPLGAHRDTWGSNIMAQTNWWAPVWPVTPARTLAIFPAHFRRAVPNTSADWDFAELLRRIKAGENTDNYPLLPLATDPPAWDDGVPITIEHGDLMAFSGAQLHASVPNTTDETRFSFEVRTVAGAEVTAGRGAPNVDGAAPRTTYQWFKSQRSGDKLGVMA